MKPGDLVTMYTFETDEIVGVVLEVNQMKDTYRDSGGNDPMYSATVLWEKDVPTFMGSGRICKVPDAILKVISVNQEEGVVG